MHYVPFLCAQMWDGSQFNILLLQSLRPLSGAQHFIRIQLAIRQFFMHCQGRCRFIRKEKQMTVLVPALFVSLVCSTHNEFHTIATYREAECFQVPEVLCTYLLIQCAIAHALDKFCEHVYQEPVLQIF